MSLPSRYLVTHTQIALSGCAVTPLGGRVGGGEIAYDDGVRV